MDSKRRNANMQGESRYWPRWLLGLLVIALLPVSVWAEEDSDEPLEPPPVVDLLSDLDDELAPPPEVELVPPDLMEKLRPEDVGLKSFPKNQKHVVNWTGPPQVRYDHEYMAQAVAVAEEAAAKILEQSQRPLNGSQFPANASDHNSQVPVAYATPVAYGASRLKLQQAPPNHPNPALRPSMRTTMTLDASIYERPVEIRPPQNGLPQVTMPSQPVAPSLPPEQIAESTTMVDPNVALVGYVKEPLSVSPPVPATSATSAVSDADANLGSGEANQEDSVFLKPTEQPSTGQPAPESVAALTEGLSQWAEPENFESTLRTFGLLTVISLAPAILLMTTSFVRISIVLGLLRQAIGAQMLPSNQIVTSLAMFLTALVMTPVWTQVYNDAIVPYTAEGSSMTATQAWDAGVAPVRSFMAQQIHAANNDEDVLMFYDYLPSPGQAPASYDDVPLQVLLPAFMLSELKTAFLMGFQIFLPFLILDLVVSSVTVSMGMMMLPPAMVSLPLKLILFVLVDGWQLVVGMLLQSFAGFV